MFNSNDMERRIVVLKIGGSIFTEDDAYRRADEFVRNRFEAAADERCVVVVSAQNGTTDAQERAARRIVPSCDPKVLDLLWSTGELSSVAMLTMHLHAWGVEAVGLNVHETGLRVSGPAFTNGYIEFVPSGLKAVLAQHAVAVVPGFLGTNFEG
jgi:aspartokinase